MFHHICFRDILHITNRFVYPVQHIISPPSFHIAPCSLPMFFSASPTPHLGLLPSPREQAPDPLWACSRGVAGKLPRGCELAEKWQTQWRLLATALPQITCSRTIHDDPERESNVWEDGVFSFEGKSESLARVKAKKSIQNHIYFIIYQYIRLYHGRYSRFVQNWLFVSVLIQSIYMIYNTLSTILYRF